MFCPQCGREDEDLIQGLCRSCFIKETQIISCPKEIQITICAHCPSYHSSGKWIEKEIDMDELIEEAINNDLNLHNLLENPQLSIEYLNQKGSLLEVLLKVQGDLVGSKVQEMCTLNVRINRTVCPDCSKYASGYYEAVIQLRADSRVPNQEEIEIADGIIKEGLEQLSKTNRMAYLADRAELKEGIDYYLGSYKAAKKIANGLKDKMGGLIGESPRLMGRDKSKGKDLYRVWISIRLPRFKIGDFLRGEGLLGQVINLDGRGILIRNLSSQKMQSIPWREYSQLEKVANGSDVKKTTITNITPHELQILHPETYQTYELDLIEDQEFEVGSEVDVIDINGFLYIVSKKITP